MIDQVGRSALNFALLAGGTEPAAFAGKGQEVFVLAIVAANAGKPAFEGAAVDEFFHDLFDHRAKGAVLGLIGI